MFSRRRAVFLTGGSGFVGGLTAAALLADGEEVIVPVRPHHNIDELRGLIGFALTPFGRAYDRQLLFERLHLVQAADLTNVESYASLLAELQVVEIVHSAGCLDYFDKANLELINVGLTRSMLELGRRWEVERFIYVSTAYSCGYIDRVAPEALHEEPPADPTDYTRTKRAAEKLVAESGLPFQIMRPSVVIGTSTGGEYSGKRYGLYQLWNGVERFQCRDYLPVVHVVAPPWKVSFLHQDSYQRAFLAARRKLPAGTFIHLDSRQETAPTMRDVLDMWARKVSRPREIVYYQSVRDVPLRSLDSKNRAFISLCWANLEIAEHNWRFATDHLETLRAGGLDFSDATLATLEICQDRFVESSQIVQKFLQRFHS